MDVLENVNIFIKAPTPEELVKLQVLNNHVNNVRYAYQTPMFVDGDWYAWFFANLHEYIDPTKLEENDLRALGVNL